MPVSLMQRIKETRLAKGPFLAAIPVLTFALTFGIFIVLILTGVISFGSTEINNSIDQERGRIVKSVENQLGDISVEALQLSRLLSGNIENLLENAGAGLPIEALSYHPDMLELIVENQLGLILIALDKAKVSGVFMALEATVNPYAPGSRYSRAGIYIRNTEPAVQGNSYKLFLRGFADYALKNNLTLQSNWNLEFNIRNKDYYTAPADTFKNNPSLPLSRSYYWTFTDPIDAADDDDVKEPTLLCCVPLISSRGKFLGVCGFEISESNFRLLHSPSDQHLFCTFAPFDGTGLENKKTFETGYHRGSAVFTDQYKILKLYPDNSPYIDKKMALSIGISAQDYKRQLLSRNIVLIVILCILGSGVLVFSIFLNRYYKKAYADQLLKLEAQLVKAPPDFDKYDLTKREKEICVLLLKGFSLRQIGDQLFIAFDTVNNHCRNIYRKLEINNRKELFLKFGS